MSGSPFVRRKLVMVESPFSAPTAEGLLRNSQYLREALEDSMKLGEAPFAMHGFYTQFLDDTKEEERNLGLACGLNWMTQADLVAFYYDLGVSHGMREGIVFAAKNGLKIEFRSLASWRS